MEEDFKGTEDLQRKISEELSGSRAGFGFLGVVRSITLVLLLNYLVAPFVLYMYHPNNKQERFIYNIITYTYLLANPEIRERLRK